MLEERKARYHVANAFLSRLELIWLIYIQVENLQNVQKMHFWQKAPGVNGLSFSQFTIFKSLVSSTPASLLLKRKQWPMTQEDGICRGSAVYFSVSINQPLMWKTYFSISLKYWAISVQSIKILPHCSKSSLQPTSNREPQWLISSLIVTMSITLVASCRILSQHRELLWMYFCSIHSTACTTASDHQWGGELSNSHSLNFGHDVESVSKQWIIRSNNQIYWYQTILVWSE